MSKHRGQHGNPHDRTREFGVQIHGEHKTLMRDEKIIYCSCGGACRFDIGQFGQSLVRCEKCKKISPLSATRTK